MVVRAGSAVVGTWPLDRSGDLDITFRVPADAIQSNVGLALDIRYLPHRVTRRGTHITFIISPNPRWRYPRGHRLVGASACSRWRSRLHSTWLSTGPTRSDSPPRQSI